ncbi:MAG: hypothetical protein AB7U82_03065 [Blastocatellales bacterium]
MINPAKTLRSLFPPLIFLLLSVRLFTLIHNHAVNILYWDQWDYYQPMFSGASWLELFRWQYGAHRQGLGFILTRAIAELTGWNTRIEAFAIGGLVCLAAMAALCLKRRLFGALNIYDIAIPLIVLTTAQFQTFVGAVNPAPAAFPLLLLALYCLAWTIAGNFRRCALTLLLNHLLIYTGYGFFIGAITPVLFAVESWRRRNDKRELIYSLIALAISLLSVYSFFSDYDFSQLQNSAQRRAARFWEYPLFAGLMFGRFMRPETGQITWLTYLAMLCGLVLSLLAVIILLIHCRRILRSESAERQVSLTIVILFGYALLFAASTAFGRASMGLNLSQSSRYVTLMIPGFLAIYFHLLTIKRESLRRFGLPIFLLLLLPGHLPLRLGESHPAGFYSRNKRAWKECYLRTGDYKRCESISDFKLLPSQPPEAIKRKLDYLKRHRLNLFADSR